MHRLINYKNTKAKWRHLKEWPGKVLCDRCLYVWGPEPPSPPYRLYNMYTLYLCTQGRGEVGGGESWTRGKVIRATVHKLGRNYQHVRLYLQSIKSDKHLSQSPFTGQFLDGDILHCLLWVSSFYGAMKRFWCHLLKNWYLKLMLWILVWNPFTRASDKCQWEYKNIVSA